MQTIRDWSAKRSGAAITIVGKFVAGGRARVAVDRIEAGSPLPVAVARDGTRFELAAQA